jgi:uncharacterized FlaG/YvyC family protein
MSETSITPISGVRLTETSTQLRTQPSTSVDALATLKPDAPGQDRPLRQIENEIKKSSNVSVHFRVNDETNELTVFIVDRDSKKVLRSIPVSEFYKMSAGDVLQMLI